MEHNPRSRGQIWSRSPSYGHNAVVKEWYCLLAWLVVACLIYGKKGCSDVLKGGRGWSSQIDSAPIHRSWSHYSMCPGIVPGGVKRSLPGKGLPIELIESLPMGNPVMSSDEVHAVCCSDRVMLFGSGASMGRMEVH